MAMLNISKFKFKFKTKYIWHGDEYEYIHVYSFDSCDENHILDLNNFLNALCL
jgi:hypothetical protein